MPQKQKQTELVTSLMDIRSILREEGLRTLEVNEKEGQILLRHVRLGATTVDLLIHLANQPGRDYMVCHVRCYSPLFPSEASPVSLLARLLKENRPGPWVPYFALDDADQLIMCFTFPILRKGISREEFMNGFLTPIMKLRKLFPQILREMGGEMPIMDEFIPAVKAVMEKHPQLGAAIKKELEGRISQKEKETRKPKDLRNILNELGVGKFIPLE